MLSIPLLNRMKTQTTRKHMTKMLKRIQIIRDIIINCWKKAFDQSDIEQKNASDKNVLSQEEHIEVFAGLSEHLFINDVIQEDILNFEPDFKIMFKDELTEDVVDTSLK
ncbi:hypothetical protein GJ496_010025 [Pomphorhynchus laevis]|nr:hypothetical protein GJ496_010025 [Pomphorhynchus laevis]